MPRLGKDLLGDRHVLPCRQHDGHVTVYFNFCMVIVKWVSNAKHAASTVVCEDKKYRKSWNWLDARSLWVLFCICM